MGCCKGKRDILPLNESITGPPLSGYKEQRSHIPEELIIEAGHSLRMCLLFPLQKNDYQRLPSWARAVNIGYEKIVNVKQILERTCK